MKDIQNVMHRICVFFGLPQILCLVSFSCFSCSLTFLPVVKCRMNQNELENENWRMRMRMRMKMRMRMRMRMRIVE